MTERQTEGGTGLSIIILDDEPIVCKRLKPTLQRKGYEVETFSDGPQALARLEERVFDIVITDLKMGTIDGMHVLENVKAAHPDTQVIIISGFATLETAKESFRKGAFDFVAKPFKINEILECVKRIEENRNKGKK